MSLKHSSAYNYLEMQEPIVQQPLELRVYKRNGLSRELSLQLLAGVALIASLLVMLIYSNIMLTELGDQISIKKGQYEILKSENRRMTVELEGKVSLRNIEQSAVATMGMAKVEPYQVEYVNLGSGDKIQVASSKLDPITSKVQQVIGIFMDYVGL